MTLTGVPAQASSDASRTPSQTIAGTRAVRSPSTRRRNSPPSRRARRSTSRTRSTWSNSVPSVASRSSIQLKVIRDADGYGMAMADGGDASVVISGGTGGLGAAVTRTMLDAGWHVVLPYVERGELGRVAAHPRLAPVEADLFEPSAAVAVVAAAAA